MTNTSEMTVALRVLADTQSAQVGLKSVAESLREMGVQGKAAGASAPGIANTGAAISGAARGTDALGQSSKAAAQYAGQLTFQLNDIGMMLASGQNPFMLMMQQGPQVTQVFDQMRQSGMALGPSIAGAFTQMLNPVSLATMAIIGGGAVALQWFLSTETGALTAADAISELTAQIDSYADAAGRANGPTSDLVSEFGAAPEAARQYLRDLAEIERRDAERSARAAMQTLKSEVAPTSLFSSDQRNLADTLDLSVFARADTRLINPILDAFNDVENAAGIDAQVEALERLKAAMTAAAAASGTFNQQEDAALLSINTMLIEQSRLREVIRSDEAAAQAIERENEGRGSQSAADAALNEFRAERVRLAREDAAVAAELLETLGAQAEMASLIAVNGEDSVAVAAARVNAEREVFASMVQSLDVAGSVKLELMATWDAANGTASANIRGMLAAALGPAAALAAKMWDAASAAVSMRAAQQQLAASGMEYGRVGARGDPRSANRQGQGRFVYSGPSLDRYNQPVASGAGHGGGGSGGARGDSVAGLSAEARELLAELDIGAAAVAEKVKAGLVSVAEGTREMASAKERAGGQLADLIAKLDRLGPAGKAAAEAARQSLADLAKEARGASDSINNSLVKSFEENFAKSLATGKNAMSAFTDHLLMELSRAFTSSFVTPMITPLISAFTGMFGFADGGVPDAPALAAHSNTVVNRPTPFAMAGGGLGVMGEAGPEAILPLLNGSGGLGVRAIGADGAQDILPLQRAPGGALGVTMPDFGALLRRPTYFAKGGVAGGAAGAAAADLGTLLKRPTYFAKGGVAGGAAGAAVADVHPDLGALLSRPTFLAGGSVAARLTEAPPISAAGSGGGMDRAPRMNVVVNNNNPGAKVEARQRQGADGMSLEIIVEQLESAIADRTRRNIGPLAGVLGSSYNLNRVGS